MPQLMKDYIALSTISQAIIEREQEAHRCQAHQNAIKWGVQDFDTLVMAISEQSGKISQSCLHFRFEHGKYTKGELVGHARHMAALCIQLAFAIEQSPFDL